MPQLRLPFCCVEAWCLRLSLKLGEAANDRYRLGHDLGESEGGSVGAHASFSRSDVGQRARSALDALRSMPVRSTAGGLHSDCIWISAFAHTPQLLESLYREQNKPVAADFM